MGRAGSFAKVTKVGDGASGYGRKGDGGGRR